MRKLFVHTKSRAGIYPVMVGARVEDAAAIAKASNASKAAIVFSKNTAAIAERVAAAAREQGLPQCMLEIQDGEESKSFATLQALLEKMRGEKLDRDSVLIAVGGGVLGDVAGFAAAVYMRGIALVQVPTTLVAMADSSVGGKTGVNLGEKNLVGAFHQPKAVVIDFSVLRTLPAEEARQGLAEIVKCACIRSPQLFKYLEENVEKAVAHEENVLEHMVREAVEIKADIVGKDEREAREFADSGNSRMRLNFGHSLGHALEKASNYSIKHGDAVSAGIVGECAIAQKMGLLTESECARVKTLLKKLGLPTAAPGVDAQKALDALQADKKNASQELVMVLLHAIGRPEVVKGVPQEIAAKALKELVSK